METASLIGTQILDHLYSKYTVEEEDIQAALLGKDFAVVYR